MTPRQLAARLLNLPAYVELGPGHVVSIEGGTLYVNPRNYRVYLKLAIGSGILFYFEPGNAGWCRAPKRMRRPNESAPVTLGAPRRAARHPSQLVIES